MIKLDAVTKSYRAGEVETTALDHVSLQIGLGEFVAITGPSGCGKSTLLNILGLLDRPTAGAYWLGEKEVSKCTEKQLTLLRRASIGFVFQSFNLIEDLNVSDNVDVALMYRGVSSKERKERIAEALNRVGLHHRASHRPQQLSGGQQQRVAIARALVARPKLILADEPTGNLDTANGDAVMELLAGVTAGGTTVVMVTHSPEYAQQTGRTIKMLDGQIVAETKLAA